MEKGKLVGKGMTSDVYEWGQGKVLKLFAERYSKDWVSLEAKKGYIVHNTGISSPYVFDVIDLDNRSGIILERVYGKSMLRQIQEKPWKSCLLALRLARFHFKIHQHFSDELPSQTERFAFAINRSSKLDGETRNKIIGYVDSLPNSRSICHGDLHFKNVIVSNNKLVAIDWSGSYQGNPLGDVARTCMLMLSPSNPTRIPDIIVNAFQYAKLLIYRTYLNEYMRLAKVSFQDIDDWTLPVAAAKLKDKVPGDESWLIDIINKRLKKYNL